MTQVLEQEWSSHREFRASVSCSNQIAFSYGTGLSIYDDTLLPAISDAKHEVVLATCFWAPSKTLDRLVSTLKALSARTVASNDKHKIKVYISFSSRSALQKLFHTDSPDGYTYSPTEQVRKLGLPPASELPGLDLAVKSLFFRPFSVLHSKYLIVDRQKVFLPSCNVSWEDWYECVVGFEGPIVQHVFEFWKEVWRPATPTDLPFCKQYSDRGPLPAESDIAPESASPSHQLQTTLLPHPHDASIQQAFWFLPKRAPLPTSPLNETLLQLIAHARSELILLTPNFTAQAAFDAVSLALTNGVAVHLITDRKMMVPEQLATAGVLTEQCVDRLIKEYMTGFIKKKMQNRLREVASLSGITETESRSRAGSVVSASSKSKPSGSLKVSYFRQPTERTAGAGIASQATKSHIKLTFVDGRAMILGSGNMDRASWRTSQELGVLIEDQDEGAVVRGMWNKIEAGLEGCLEVFFES